MPAINETSGPMSIVVVQKPARPSQRLESQLAEISGSCGTLFRAKLFLFAAPILYVTLRLSPAPTAASQPGLDAGLGCAGMCGHIAVARRSCRLGWPVRSMARLDPLADREKTHASLRETHSDLLAALGAVRVEIDVLNSRSLRRREDDHGAARPAHPPLRHRRNGKRKLPIQEPKLIDQVLVRIARRKVVRIARRLTGGVTCGDIVIVRDRNCIHLVGTELRH